ncbi:hypothetical protein ATCC90586_002972 [Pythium insidiosum]|nr:hypothetical protein ATCC90586_002972 [Pythium insidiosum]
MPHVVDVAETATSPDSDAAKFRYSYMTAHTPVQAPHAHGHHGLHGDRLSHSAPPADVFVRGSLHDRTIEAVTMTQATNAGRPERASDYRGRRRIWPGILLFLLIFGSAGGLITVFGRRAWTASQERGTEYELQQFKSRQIKGGSNASVVGGDFVEDDGVIGNPKKYPSSVCDLPDYQSKNGKLFAVAKNGTEVPIKIKGINWFGMEGPEGIPLGLWENSNNGTTAYSIATFLASNRYNAVRLPLMVQWILDNKVPNPALINKESNRALNIADYMSLLKGIVKSLAFRKIGVLISMHTLTEKDNGKLWYNDAISEDKFLESIDILTKNLCNNEYWNIMGIDLKNEPYKATWGDGTPSDFRAGAVRIANRMLKGCPQWLGFVEGVYAEDHKITLDGKETKYADWYGGGLQGAKTKGVDFSIPNKVVWAPHYYTPAVFPQDYLYANGTRVGNALKDYKELDDDGLRRRIKDTMDDMFGFLASETGPALVLGEFGGLYSLDKHPQKTTKRCTDFTIEIIKRRGWAGGFVWSLNPESEYQYNPADQPGSPVGTAISSPGTNVTSSYVGVTSRASADADAPGGVFVWPGIVLLLLVVGAATALIVHFATKAEASSDKRGHDYELKQFRQRQIKGGRNDTTVVGNDIVSDDGVIGNPKKYPPSECELPDYQSKNGQIVAVSKNGTEVPIKIKGVNWFGMEDIEAIPLGIWENMDNGTTVYSIATFLASNRFNAVRLPLMAKWILDNKVPNADLLNKESNRAISTKDYMSLLKSLIKALAYRKIGVLISMHTLSHGDNGPLWYNDAVPEPKFLDAIEILTTNLCSKDYWNVMGIDLKNEPYLATWGDGSATDFRAGAKRIAARMHAGCPQWLGFVEGLYKTGHKVEIDGESVPYADWYGGGLQVVKTQGLDFAVPNKLVWAPHYYTPAVFPQAYLFGGGTFTDGGYKDYKELEDATLRKRIEGTMHDMFGYLATETGPAVVLGEFGGLYSTDKHPMKTTKRCTDFTIEVITKKSYAGGFVWSLNPESKYDYNPSDRTGKFVEGLLQPDWLSVNEEYLKALAGMDSMPNLRSFPCFETHSTT